MIIDTSLRKIVCRQFSVGLWRLLQFAAENLVITLAVKRLVFIQQWRNFNQRTV